MDRREWLKSGLLNRGFGQNFVVFPVGKHKTRSSPSLLESGPPRLTKLDVLGLTPIHLFSSLCTNSVNLMVTLLVSDSQLALY